MSASPLLRIIQITSLLPAGHYSEILCGALQQFSDSLLLIVYADRRKENQQMNGCGTIKLVWEKGVGFFWSTYWSILRDRPSAVHVQHEFNMFGGMMVNLLLPFYLLFCRMTVCPVVITLHGVVAPKQVDDDFHKLFYLSRFIPVWMIRFVFYLFYIGCGQGASRIICHTNLMKLVLTDSYHVPSSKIEVIRPVVPVKKRIVCKRQPYFLYYGYLVKRKGLEKVLMDFADFVKLYPQYRLILAGGVIAGQERAEQDIRKLIQSLDIINNIELYGFVHTEQELEVLYAQAEAVMIPARLSIAASGPLYHARGYGAAIFVSNEGNLSEEAEAGQDAYIVKNEQWKKTFLDIAEGRINLEVLRTLSKQAAKRYHPRVMAKEYERLYSELCK